MSKTTPCCAKAAGRGRPPDPGKREAILEAAACLFMTQGYGVSMETIAAEAGVSKQTIYNLFSTKEELFGMIIASRSEMILSPIRPILDEVDVLREDTDPREVLLEFARQLLRLVTSEPVRKVYDIVNSVEANVGGPALSEYFFKNGPLRTARYFVDYLTGQQEKGRLRVPDPDLAAESFFGMLNGFIPMRNALGLPNDLDEETIDRRARYCVDLFLRTHAAGDTKAST